MVIDSKNVYGFFKLAVIARIIVGLMGNVVDPIQSIIALIFAYALYLVGSRPHIGRGFIAILALIDFAGAVLLVRNPVIKTTIIVNSIVVLLFYLLVLLELRIIPRPVYELNPEEMERARKALQTKLPEDIQAISKYRSWNPDE